MKKNLICFFMLAAFAGWVNAQQLTNTKWSGEANIPNKEPIVLEFKNVAASVYVKGDVVEYMWYKQEGNTLFLSKYWGGSPCKADDNVEAKLSIEVTKDKLVLHLLEDKCTDRGKSLDGLVLKRIK